MPAYEAGDFEPPAPVARVVVRGQNNRVRRDVPMLIDTGADISLVPRDVAESIAAITRPSEAPIQFLNGEEVHCLQAELTIEFLRYRFRGPFLVAECSHGILGRNILNLLRVTLDGRNLSWTA